MEECNKYTVELINLLAKKSNIDISKYDMDEIVMGMSVELEHGSKNDITNITDDYPIQTLKIALAHLDEIKDYYTRLKKMEGNKPSEKKDESKENLKENKMAKRFKELSGIMENESKKQLINEQYRNKVQPKLLNEVSNPEDFEFVKFKNDGFGKKETEEENKLYKMD